MKDIFIRIKLHKYKDRAGQNVIESASISNGAPSTTFANTFYKLLSSLPKDFLKDTNKYTISDGEVVKKQYIL